MEEVGGTVIGKRGGNRSGRGGEGGSARSAGLRRCSSANTAVTVPPSPPLSSPHTTASLTLASMSMTAPTTPMLVSGDAEEVKDSTGSDKASPTETEVPTGVSLQERERKNKDRERKRKDREAAKQKAFPPVHMGVSVSASSPAPSTVIQLRSSPTKELRAGVPATLNWTTGDDVRMLLVACSEPMQELFGILGHPSNRHELEGSNSATDARPTTAFFEQLAKTFSNSDFKGFIPDCWDHDVHLPQNKSYPLRQGRSADWMHDKWRCLGARYEIAWRRFSNVSGTDGDSCFCGCGKLGFWTTSGFVASHANKISSDRSFDHDGDRKCVAPAPHVGVYAWSVAMKNNLCMRLKGSIAIPRGVRSHGLVGSASTPALKRVAPSVRTDDLDETDERTHEETSGRAGGNKKNKMKPTPHDHSGHTFMDDGKSGKGTRAARESGLITAINNLAPERQSPLDVLLKRQTDLRNEEQVLLMNLTLAQSCVKNTDPSDTAGMDWAKNKVTKLQAKLDENERCQDVVSAGILEAQEDEAECARSKARRRALLSSLEDEDGRGKHDAEGSTDEPGA